MHDKHSLIQSLIQIADDQLILGHRLSEWCGHAPLLEEDLSMPNMALDLIGQARNLYAYAADLEGIGRDEDQIAYLRLERQYQNILLVERPNTDFAHTMLRQFYFTAFMKPYWTWIAQNSSDETLAGYAAKGVKEVSYHIKHCAEWIIRLGDGTTESAEKMQAAVASLHPFCEELFVDTQDMKAAIDNNLLPSRNDMRVQWNETLSMVFREALLEIPDVPYPQLGGREGKHTEDMGFLLTQLQYMQRTYPGMTW